MLSPSTETDRPAKNVSKSGAGYDFVCFAVSSWGLVKSNPDYTILGLIERGHRVLVVEPLMTMSSELRTAVWQRRRVQHDWSLRRVQENLWVYTPPPIGLPGMSRHPAAGRLSGQLLAWLVRRQMAALGFRNPIVWSFMYNAGTTLAALPARLRLYECGDDDAALAGTERQRRTVRTLEAEICAISDRVFCVTDELSASRRQWNRQVMTVNCGVDARVFRPPRAGDPPPPEPIARLKRPVIGYVGGLDPWKIDIPLIREIARKRPDWSFAFVGYVWFGFDTKVFGDLPNVHVLGPQPYEQLPEIMRGMDVGIMPFPLNDITRNGDALKCYEYLASGLPVVSRSVPVSRRLQPLVRLAETADDFVAEIEAALAEGQAGAQARADAMGAHDWRERVAQKLAVIDAHLA